MNDDTAQSERPAGIVVDCRQPVMDLWNIMGSTESDMNALTDQMPKDEVVLAIMPIQSHPGWFFGAANFKIEPDDPSTWKFVRSYQEIIESGIFGGLENRFGITLDRIILGPGIYNRFLNNPSVAAYHAIAEFREEP